MKKHDTTTAPATAAKGTAPVRRESELGPELYTGTLFARDAHLSAPRGTAALREQLELMRLLRDSVIASPTAATPELLAEVMGFQRKDGSFSLVTDYRIDGDCRVFGRFYLGTGSSGLLCGTPVHHERRNDP